MSGFEIPDWAMPQPANAPPQPPDPAALREQQIADNTRAEQALNSFIAAKQAALFEAPDAFYRTQGEDAIHAVPVATQKLDELRRDLLDKLGNDTQRQRLADALDAQMHLAREGMARHVAEQSLAWQRKVAQDRIALLAKEASYHHNDDELVDSLGHAAATAARAHARVGAAAPGGETEDAAAATARSGVLSAAIQARLDRGNTEGANALFTQVQDQLDPEHAAPLQGQIEQAQTPPLLVHPEIVGPGTIEPEAATPGTDKPATTETSPAPAAPESADGVDGLPGEALSPTGPISDRQIVINARGTMPAVDGATTPSTQNPNIVPVQFNAGESEPAADQAVQSPTSIGRSGTAPPTEPPSNSVDLEHDFEHMQGRLVRLPDGSLVVSPHSDNGYLMSPFSDLSDVAAAGRQISSRVAESMGTDILHAPSYVEKVVRDAVGHGGTWDYQRRHYAFGKDGYTQLRQFRDVANFNVGLYCQQAGIPLFFVLELAGKYAAKNSSNAAPDQPHGLDPRTREFIELGYKIGTSGVFDQPKRR